MKKVHATVNYGFVGSDSEEDFEFDDNATEGEIADEIWEWACERVDVSWEEI